MKTNLFLILCVLFGACDEGSKTILYPAPEQEQASPDFKILVVNKPIFVYQARVSKYPINQAWPGYQRPKNQTEMASFAYFDFKGDIDVEIISNQPIKTLDIRPKQFGIVPFVSGNSVKIQLVETNAIRC